MPIGRLRDVTWLVLAVLLAGTAVPSHAQDAAPLSRVIMVAGQGEITARPDQAHLSAGVVSEAPTAAGALSANSAAMNKVFAALKAAGIPDARIQTANFSVSPQYPPYRADQPQPRAIIGYQVSNQVSVTLDDLAKLGPTLDALVKSGANQLGGIVFAIADPKPLAEKARAAAVADAMAKAKTLAAAAGVTLGPVLSLQEGGGEMRPLPMMAFKAAAVAAPTPVAAGEETVTVNVSMIFAIR
jgi:uncharacterized protein YggE